MTARMPRFRIETIDVEKLFNTCHLPVFSQLNVDRSKLPANGVTVSAAFGRQGAARFAIVT